MKIRCFLILICCLAMSACSKPESASSYDAEWEKRAKQQFDDYDRQTKAVDANMAVMEQQNKRADALQDRAEEQAKRFERLLDKWEEQARRQDAIFEAEERRLGISK